MMIDYEWLDELARGLMLNRKAHLNRERGFIYRHGKRTAVSVITLRGMATDDGSHDDALRIAAMFHDLGKGIDPHARMGAALAREALAEALPPALLEEVVLLIEAHTNHQTDDLWAKLLQDADLMDHFGAVEIGISFQYGAFTETGMPSSLEWYNEMFDAHAARYRERLNFDFSRAIYDEKVAFAKAFAARLAVEMAGGYV